MRFSLFTFLLICIILCGWCGCHSRSARKTTLYTAGHVITFQLRTSCKKTSFISNNEDSIKAIVSKYTKETIARQKLKTTQKAEKATFRVLRTEFMISESCGPNTQPGKPLISLREAVFAEETATKKEIVFESDTIVIQNQALGQPATLTPKKLVLDPYISALTQKIYRQLKNHPKPKN